MAQATEVQMKMKMMAIIFLVTGLTTLKLGVGSPFTRGVALRSKYSFKVLYIAKSRGKKKRLRDASAFSHLLDERLHVAQIVFERTAAGGGQLILSLWQASFEKLR